MSETKESLLNGLSIDTSYDTLALSNIVNADHRYLKDLRVNVNNALVSDHISEKEIALLSISIAFTLKDKALEEVFIQKAKEKEASGEEIAEAISCASLLSANNILYRFRHFTGKDKYNQLPARLKMNIMMRPVLGKEFFELISLAVSAVNGCEMCVNSHEKSLMELGSSEERIFDAVRLASVIASLSKIV
ncbi:carboxymuconolactone decarboxylase family protein [Rapidithrix thailandica]|uniref:Alkyl hydroperoxide reductase AhpD n=1 Tax=Rapidithrix thailandica TaxID=413964 RepID=A0AAW9S7F6_9BACT